MIFNDLKNNDPYILFAKYPYLFQSLSRTLVSVLLIRYREITRVTATDVVLDVDRSTKILKFTGLLYKIFKCTALIKDM